jgi:hypothetical protein
MVFFGHGYKVAEMANPKIERLTRRYDNDFAEYRAPLLARRRRTPFSPELVRLRILDALAGPLPATRADRRRQRDPERIARAFPRHDGQDPGAAISRSADRLRRDD